MLFTKTHYLTNCARTSPHILRHLRCLSLSHNTQSNVGDKVSNPDPSTASSINDFKVLDIKGTVVDLSRYTGYVTYIVNVASE